MEMIVGKIGITQIIGCAHTFTPSYRFRGKRAQGEHSSQGGYQGTGFSYFRKQRAQDGQLHLKDYTTRHFPEPELAVILGEEHHILGYTLANDFTRRDVELQGRWKTEEGWKDSTHEGKYWPGSVSVGQQFFVDSDFHDKTVGLRIERNGEVIYDRSYNTNRVRNNWTPEQMVDMVAEYYQQFKSDCPPSKELQMNGGFLEPGTVVLLGSGLTLKDRLYSQPGDIVTVYCGKKEMKNKILGP